MDTERVRQPNFNYRNKCNETIYFFTHFHVNGFNFQKHMVRDEFQCDFFFHLFAGNIIIKFEIRCSDGLTHQKECVWNRFKASIEIPILHFIRFNHKYFFDSVSDPK